MYYADLEKGPICFVKDLKSRNKARSNASCLAWICMTISELRKLLQTMWMQNGKWITLFPKDRYAVPSGAVLKFGALECKLHFGKRMVRWLNMLSRPILSWELTNGLELVLAQTTTAEDTMAVQPLGLRQVTMMRTSVYVILVG